MSMYFFPQEAVGDTLEELWISYNNIEKLRGITSLKKLRVSASLLAGNNIRLCTRRWNAWYAVELCGHNGGGVHYVMVSKIQWKPFWLATGAPSSIYKTTGLGGKMVWTMTYAHWPNCLLSTTPIHPSILAHVSQISKKYHHALSQHQHELKA